MQSFVKKGIAFCLIICCFIGVISCGEKMTKNPDSKENYLFLIENEKTNYQIVVPRGDGILFDLADHISEEFEAIAGIRMGVVNDAHEKSEFEIVIGQTVREIPESFAKELKTPDDWCLFVEGNSIYIYTLNETSARAAIAFFQEAIVIEESAKIIKIDRECQKIYHSTANYITVVEGHSSEYVIACQTELNEYGEQVQKLIEQKCGVTLSIVNQVPAGKALLIGNMNSAEGKKACEKLPCVTDVGLVAVGNKIVLATNYETGLSNAVNMLETTIKEYSFHEKWMIPEGYCKIYEKTTKDLAAYISMINANDPTVRIVNIEKTRIYTPDGTESAWYYSHHPFITKFKGKFYAVYSSGRTNEDDCGQRIMLATSENFTDWTVKGLVDSIWGDHSYLTLYATGLYTDGETLTAFYSSYEYDQETLRKNADGSDLRPEESGAKRTRFAPRYLQTTDGMNWSEAREITGTVGTRLYCGNLSPVKLQSGRLMWAGYCSMAISPEGNITGDWSGRFIPLADGESRPNSFSEAGFFQRSDGAVFLFSRTDGGTMICAASADEGRTWTDCYHTQITDHGAKFEFGTLPDGRYYYLGNADNKRSSVVLMISKDGINFNEWYILEDEPYALMKEGMYKAGVYGYPTSYIDENYMYVIYSLRKESVEVLRVPLSSIGVK